MSRCPHLPNDTPTSKGIKDWLLRCADEMEQLERDLAAVTKERDELRRDRERLLSMLSKCEDFFYRTRVLGKASIMKRSIELREEIAKLNPDILP